jgi:RNA polymerase sigma-70 factor (ECF subfamily)
LANPAPLVRRVYAYAAYRLGDGPDAEDATSEVFENAIRYRDSYDPTKGEPLTWLIGIARRCVAKTIVRRATAPAELIELEAATDVESETLDRLTLDDALAMLGERDQDLLALRYAIDLHPREIAALLEISPNAATVALHRAVARLRSILEAQEDTESEGQARRTAPGDVGDVDSAL